MLAAEMLDKSGQSVPGPHEPATPHRVAMLIYPDAQILDITGPLEVFARCARWLSEQRSFRVPAYSVELIAGVAGRVRTSGGLELIARRSWRDLDEADTLLVTGGIGFQAACEDPALLSWLAGQATRTPRIGSICTGAMLLAAAGLLKGRTATTHWAYLDLLAQRAPGCEIDRESIYVESGHVYTSAGVTAGIDLALALVERDWGKATSVAVAEALVVYRRRTANMSQRSRFIEAERRDDQFGALQLWILDHLDEDLSVERMAAVAAMSPRNFSRRFKARIGTAPVEYVARVRLEEACRRIEGGAPSLKLVARQCGFADEQNLRRAFQRYLGTLPQSYRGA